MQEHEKITKSLVFRVQSIIFPLVSLAHSNVIKSVGFLMCYVAYTDLAFTFIVLFLSETSTPRP